MYSTGGATAPSYFPSLGYSDWHGWVKAVGLMSVLLKLSLSALLHPWDSAVKAKRRQGKHSLCLICISRAVAASLLVGCDAFAE